jgi:Zn-dependent peptidase ImmA (M78 family)
MTPQERAYKAIEGLHLPASLTVENLITLVASLSGRPIRFLEEPGLKKSGICGCWLKVDDSHVILLATFGSDFHRQQTILHELSHIILSHFRLAESVDAITTNFRHLKPADIEQALQRAQFDTPNELAAEFLADLLANEIRLGNRNTHRFFKVFG